MSARIQTPTSILTSNADTKFSDTANSVLKIWRLPLSQHHYQPWTQGQFIPILIESNRCSYGRNKANNSVSGKRTHGTQAQRSTYKFFRLISIHFF